MSNINKILIAVVSCVFMICVASVSIVSIVTSNKNETTTTVPVNQQAGESTTEAPPAPQQTQSTSETAATTPSSATSTTSASVASTTTAAANTGNLASDILGKWTDSAGLSGYEFMEGGKVNWTYVNLNQFGVPFDGKASGLYTLEGDTLTVKFSIYSATIKKVYRVSVNENELSMYDLEDFELSTYARAS